MLHGFTQTASSWGRFGQALGLARPLFGVDLPGHGVAAAVRGDLRQTAEALARAARPLVETPAGPGRLDVLGYSMGARMALHLALAHPELLGALVLMSGTPGIVDPEARAARRRRDQALADDLERRADLEGFIERWMAAPMFATLDPQAAGREARLANTCAGLASSLRLAGTGSQQPLWGALGRIRAPTLVLTGATDPRFTAIGGAMAQHLPAGTLSVVPGAGHAVHLEQPGVVARLVATWLGWMDQGG